MRIAIVDDAGFGTGLGLAGKELYVELLAKVNEQILGNKVLRISLGGVVNDGVSSTIKGSKTPILRIFHDKMLVKNLSSLLRQNGVDLIHANILNARYPLSLVKASKESQTPIITTAHDWTFVCPARWAVRFPSLELCKPGFHFACLRTLWNLAKLNNSNRLSFIFQGANQYFALRHLIGNSFSIISPSSQLAQALRQSTNCDNISAIPNPIPDELLNEPQYERGNELAMAFYGRLTFEKGAHLLPMLARQNPDIRFHIMGAGPLAVQISEAAKTQKNIEYHGFVSNDEKLRIVGNCRGVIMPGLWREIFGYSTVEAFALGKPVVGFALGGVQELIQESGCGLLAKPGDVAEMSEIIRILAKDIDLAISQGKKGRKYVEGRLSLKSYAKALESVYTGIPKQRTKSE